MSLRNAALTAARHSQAYDGVILYNNGSRLILAENGQAFYERTVGGAGQARRVHELYQQTLKNFPHLSPPDALDSAIEYMRAARRKASRRMGRRQSWHP